MFFLQGPHWRTPLLVRSLRSGLHPEQHLQEPREELRPWRRRREEGAAGGGERGVFVLVGGSVSGKRTKGQGGRRPEDIRRAEEAAATARGVGPCPSFRRCCTGRRRRQQQQQRDKHGGQLPLGHGRQRAAGVQHGHVGLSQGLVSLESDEGLPSGTAIRFKAREGNKICDSICLVAVHFSARLRQRRNVKKSSPW